MPGLARRPDLLGRPPQRLGVEAVGRVGPRRAGRPRPTVSRLRCVRTRLIGRSSASASSVRGRVAAREQPGDRQPLGVGERAQDVVGRLGHVGASPSMLRMQLTDPQRRTLDQLIGTGERPVFPADLAAAAPRPDRGGRPRARARRAAVARQGEAQRPRPVRGHLLVEDRRARRRRSSTTRATAVGRRCSTGRSRSMVGAREAARPRTRPRSSPPTRTVENEERFAEYWRELRAPEQDDLLMEVVRRTDPVRGLVPAAARAPARARARRPSCRCAPSCSAARSSSRARSTCCSGAPDRIEPMRAHPARRST